MSTADTFPQNCFPTEVQAPSDGVALEPHRSPDSHDTGQTARSARGQDTSLDPPSAQTQGQVVAFDKREEQAGQPSAKPSLLDKIIGWIEKTIGEKWNNPYFIEKGKLRRTGVLAARRAQNQS
ncbi:hypothetical protein ACEPAF_9169 [Sanghuangporus sanghuang]